MNLKFKQYTLNKIQAPNFLMNPVELKDYIDFDVKRTYFITSPTGATGAHCHKIEKEFFILINGSCTAVIDSGKGLREYKIEAPSASMYVSEYVWHHFKDFSLDAILLALSSTNYNPNRSDYIEDYEEYQKIINKL